MAADTTQQTGQTLIHHLEGLNKKDVDAMMSDYTEDSTLYTPDGSFTGLKAIRGYFENFIQKMPPGFLENFKMTRQDIRGEIAYLVWNSNPSIALGTDTFIIRGGKIIVQTFAAYMPS